MQFDAVFNWQKTQTVTRSHERDTDFAAQSPNEACKNCPKIHGQTGGEYTKKTKPPKCDRGVIEEHFGPYTM